MSNALLPRARGHPQEEQQKPPPQLQPQLQPQMQTQLQTQLPTQLPTQPPRLQSTSPQTASLPPPPPPPTRPPSGNDRPDGPPDERRDSLRDGDVSPETPPDTADGVDGVDDESPEAVPSEPASPLAADGVDGADLRVMGGGTAKPVTACFNCRALRQKCDRKQPCSRCLLRQRPCRYPSGSNRGRKHGNAFLHNTHAATVDRLLSRISETAERDQVVAALLNFAGANQQSQQPQQQHQQHRQQQQLQQHHQQHHQHHQGTTAATSPLPPASPDTSPSPPPPSTSRAVVSHHHSHHHLLLASTAGAETEFLASLVSPLHIMAAAITADTAPYHRSPDSPTASALLGGSAGSNVIDERLSRYFATRTTHQRDWQVLAAQPIDSPLKLETSTCDPVAARLIDQDDVAWYFQLFFKYRGPLIGLLDPVLHTPEYVHATSFVLFSALCALGCAVSDRPRDRVVYPALLSIAESNMKWAIAVCVKSLEAIQSILILQYWAPVCARHADDPYWLRLSHAVQLGRELGIHRSASIADHVNALAPAATSPPALRERLCRNFERTWLYTFISDKSFGIITGRSMGVAWTEIPAAASEWWRSPQTGPVDRVVSGIVEMRGLFLAAMEQRRRVDNTPAAIARWHGHTYRLLEQTRNKRCGAGQAEEGAERGAERGAEAGSKTGAAERHTLPGTYYLPVLAFYMDHSIMVLNAQALRDLIAIDQAGTSPELLHLSALNVDIASRLLDTMLHNDVLLELMVGYHDNQLIMVCHAATEIIYAIQRGGLSLTKIDQAVQKVRAIPGHLERIAARLPATSAAHLYASLSSFFVSQLDRVVRNNAERYGIAVAYGGGGGGHAHHVAGDRGATAVNRHVGQGQNHSYSQGYSSRNHNNGHGRGRNHGHSHNYNHNHHTYASHASGMAGSGADGAGAGGGGAVSFPSQPQHPSSSAAPTAPTAAASVSTGACVGASASAGAGVGAGAGTGTGTGPAIGIGSRGGPLDRIVEPDQDSLLADWWRTVDTGGLLDSTTWMDMGFLSSDQPILGAAPGGSNNNNGGGGGGGGGDDEHYSLGGPGFHQSIFQ